MSDRVDLAVFSDSCRKSPLRPLPAGQRAQQRIPERATRLIATAIGTIGIFIACVATAAAQDAPHRGGTLIIGTTQVPRHVNGAVQSGTATNLLSTQIFASPLRFDDQWKPHPYLAESWTLSPDDKTLTLHLRHDALFQDGKPITSADVAFSIMAIKANHPFSTMMAPVEKVDTPDAYTAIVRMNEPHPAILLAMSPALCPILPKHIYGDSKDLKTDPHNTQGVVGSGPFKLVSFEPGQRVVLERFDKFFEPGKPLLDKIVYSYVPDSATLALSLQRGDLNLLPFFASTTDLKRLKSDPNIVEFDKGFEGIGALNWLAFNLRHAPLSNKTVRKAIATSIDKSFVTKVLQSGFTRVANGPIVDSSPFATKDLVTYPVDLKKAAQMLDDAGFKANSSGERFKLTIDYLPGDDAQQKNVAEYVRAQLKKIGITVEVRASADFPTWAKRIAAGDFDMTMDSVFNWGDPVIGVARTYLTSNIRPIVWTNTQAYSNPKVDALLQAAGTEVNLDKRKKDYAEFQKIVTDDVPIDYINTTPYHTVYNKKVMNLPDGIWGVLSPFDDVYLK